MPLSRIGKVCDREAKELRDITGSFMINIQRLEDLIGRLSSYDPIRMKLERLHHHFTIATTDMHEICQTRQVP